MNDKWFKNDKLIKSNGELSSAMGPPMKVGIEEELTEEDLKSESLNLSRQIQRASTVIKKYRDIQNGGRNFVSSRSLEEIHEDERKFEAETRTASLRAVSVLSTCLQRFAHVSEPFTIEVNYRKPEEIPKGLPDKPLQIIGTSAHHAGILYIQRCLSTEYYGFEYVSLNADFDEQILDARIQWERMRVFDNNPLRDKSPVRATLGNDDTSIETDEVKQISGSSPVFHDDQLTLVIHGKIAKFNRTQYRLITYLYSKPRKSARIQELIANVWNKAVSEKAVQVSMGRCNENLLIAGLTAQCSLKENNGHIILELNQNK